jgi:hypothetical protein
MAGPLFYDRTKDTTSSTTGTGDIALDGTPPDGFFAFNNIYNTGELVPYAIVDSATGDWEVGIGEYDLSGDSIARTDAGVMDGTIGPGQRVSFSAGTKNVFITVPAQYSNAKYAMAIATKLNWISQ